MTESYLLKIAVNGTVMSCSFAFFALLVSTRNLFISLYSIVSIGGIVACVLSFMYFMHWELGMVETISTVILTGLSVDYVVHLGNHYVESNK